MFTGNILKRRGYHDKTFKVLAAVLTVEFINWHVLTP